MTHDWPPVPAADRIRTILLIAVPSLGDVLLCTPLLSALRAAFPAAVIDVLLREGHAGMLAGNEAVRRAIEVEKRPPPGRYLRIARGLFRKYDLVLSNSTSSRYAVYAFLAGRYRVSLVKPASSGQSLLRGLFHRHADLDTRNLHTLTQTSRLGELLGLSVDAVVTPPADPASHTRIAALLGADWTARRIAILHPTPGLPFKRWPSDRWRAVAGALLARGFEVLATGGPDREELDYLCAELGLREAGVRVIAGELALADQPALLRHATVYVGVDTLMTHMAAAAGTPVVAVFGPTDPVVWGPWPAGAVEARSSAWPRRPAQAQGNVEIVQGAFPCVPCGRRGCLDRGDSHSDCLRTLPAATVIAAVDRALARSG